MNTTQTVSLESLSLRELSDGESEQVRGGHFFLDYSEKKMHLKSHLVVHPAPQPPWDIEFGDINIEFGDTIVFELHHHYTNHHQPPKPLQ